MAKKKFNRWGSNEKVYRPKAVTPSRRTGGTPFVFAFDPASAAPDETAFAYHRGGTLVVDSLSAALDTQYRQGGTVTGRMSSRVPAQQEVVVGGIARASAFSRLNLREIAARLSPPRVRVRVPLVDYAGLEQRVSAHDEAMIDEFYSDIVLLGFGVHSQRFESPTVPWPEPPPHPEAGKAITPPRKIKRSLLGQDVADTRASDGGTKRHAQFTIVAINFKNRKTA